MIKVQFKKQYENKFEDREYFYNERKVYDEGDEVQVGDIVVVNTRYGYGIARVSQINVDNYEFEGELSHIELIIKRQKDIEKERQEQIELNQKLNKIVKECKRKQILNSLVNILNAEDYKVVEALSYEDLLQFQKRLN